ncbi:glycosyltransferase [Salinicoccus sp. CNSTN-B1]
MKKVVIISRFSSIKNIDHIIKAFKHVVEAIPEAQLEIWGGGNKKKDYLQLIDDLELKKNVSIKGYTQNPGKIYRSGALSAVTSKAEGFSLSVMESMVNATPVISYDIRYGPSDMIDDGKNGYLIKKGDIDTLSEKMVSMLKDPEKTREMGKEARYKMDEKFNIDSYREKWFTLVDELMK